MSFYTNPLALVLAQAGASFTDRWAQYRDEDRQAQRREQEQQDQLERQKQFYAYQHGIQQETLRANETANLQAQLKKNKLKAYEEGNLHQVTNEDLQLIGIEPETITIIQAKGKAALEAEAGSPEQIALIREVEREHPGYAQVIKDRVKEEGRIRDIGHAERTRTADQIEKAAKAAEAQKIQELRNAYFAEGDPEKKAEFAIRFMALSPDAFIKLAKAEKANEDRLRGLTEEQIEEEQQVALATFYEEVWPRYKAVIEEGTLLSAEQLASLAAAANEAGIIDESEIKTLWSNLARITLGQASVDAWAAFQRGGPRHFGGESAVDLTTPGSAPAVEPEPPSVPASSGRPMGGQATEEERGVMREWINDPLTGETPELTPPLDIDARVSIADTLRASEPGSTAPAVLDTFTAPAVPDTMMALPEETSTETLDEIRIQQEVDRIVQELMSKDPRLSEAEARRIVEEEVEKLQRSGSIPVGAR